MSPILERLSHIPTNKVKYIREGNKFVFGESEHEDHLSLVEKYDMGEVVLVLGPLFGKAYVDGSGYINSEDAGITLSGESSNCMPRKPLIESRMEDAKVVENITGKEVNY